MRLRDVQQSISGWVRAPEGVAAALAEEDASASDARAGEAKRRLSSLIRGDDALDATGRLEIYANAYFHRILGVLAEDYPALRDALGADGFNDLVTSYLLVAPSRHPSLRFAGDRLASFLATHPAAAGVRARAPWAADLATLEWARVEVFDAPDGSVLSRAQLASLAPERFAALELRLGAWVIPCRFEHVVDELWRSALREDAGAEATRPVVAAEPTRVLVWRKDEVVLHRRMTGLEAAAFDRLASGTRFDRLCEWTAFEIGDAQAPTQAAIWLEQWLADGVLAGMEEGSPRGAGAPSLD